MTSKFLTIRFLETMLVCCVLHFGPSIEHDLHNCPHKPKTVVGTLIQVHKKSSSVCHRTCALVLLCLRCFSLCNCEVPKASHLYTYPQKPLFFYGWKEKLQHVLSSLDKPLSFSPRSCSPYNTYLFINFS